MFARIKFELQNPDRYDSFHESFIVDATIENNRLYRNAHMGFEGSINNDLYPFVLLTDGKIDMERLIMELTRLMNADIIHQIYTTTKSKSVNILRCAGTKMMVSEIASLLLRSHRLIRLQA
jgi:hypothetical protein